MKEPYINTQINPNFRWNDLDTVLLDMDGTLLDKYFDDYFWEHYVPQQYAEKNRLSLENSRNELLKRYRSVENTLQWTDLDYWTQQLGLDISGLKMRTWWTGNTCKKKLHQRKGWPRKHSFFCHT